MSPPSPGRVLVVGAAGAFAGLVASALCARGVPVRGLVRHPTRAEAARANGADEVAVGDLRKVNSLLEALDGVRGVFHIGPVFEPDEERLGLNLVEAARESGVERVVFSSVLHPGLSALRHHAAKLPVEDAILSSGLDYAILRPAAFMQNMAAVWPTVEASGVFAEPFSVQQRKCLVDFRDVAEVAAIALGEDRLLHGTFELSAHAGMTRIEIAEAMSRALGRPVRAEAPSFTEYLASATLPYDDYGIGLVGAMYAWYDRHGFVGHELALRTILDRPPRSLDDFLADLRAGRSTVAVT